MCNNKGIFSCVHSSRNCSLGLFCLVTVEKEDMSGKSHGAADVLCVWRCEGSQDMTGSLGLVALDCDGCTSMRTAERGF